MKSPYYNPDTPTFIRRILRFSNLGRGGFTLIEVVLVLAIGGLIFLLAFLAFNQVTINRRDTQRRQDARRVLTLAENYYANSQSYPCFDSTAWSCGGGNSSSWSSFSTHHLNTSELKDPASNSAYVISPYSGHYQTAHQLSDWFLVNAPSPLRILYAIKAKCENGKLVARSANPENAIAVAVMLEKGIYCVSNS